MTGISSALGVAGLAFCAAGILCLFSRRDEHAADWFFLIANACCAASDIFRADWPWAAVSGAAALIFALLLWRRRKDRKRALRLAGAKSRALLAAVVRTMRERERARPRPVLRPQRQGA